MKAISTLDEIYNKSPMSKPKIKTGYKSGKNGAKELNSNETNFKKIVSSLEDHSETLSVLSKLVLKFNSNAENQNKKVDSMNVECTFLANALLILSKQVEELKKEVEAIKQGAYIKLPSFEDEFKGGKKL